MSPRASAPSLTPRVPGEPHRLVAGNVRYCRDHRQKSRPLSGTRDVAWSSHCLVDAEPLWPLPSDTRCRLDTPLVPGEPHRP